MAELTVESTSRSKMLPVITASTIGTAIEWYDFFLYGFFSATVFAKLFFPTFDPVTGTILAFTTNFVGFVARPVGGAFFGWFGDRVGRKSTLVTTMLLMGTATFLMGVLPGYAQIGIAAPLLLSLLRFLQGAGVGGEWGGSVLLSMEHGDDRRRGFWSSWPQTGVPIGLAIAVLAVISFKGLFPGNSFLVLGWRFPFLLSAVLIAIGLIIRLRILETPVFAALKAATRTAKTPTLDVFRHHWRQILLVVLAKGAEQAPFYIFTTFILSYGVKSLGLNVNLLYAGIFVAAVIALIAIPSFSYISDLVGRRTWYASGVVLMAIFAYPYFLLLGTKNPLVVIIAIAFSIGIVHAWLYGPQAALISERFGTSLRYSGASLGYQLSSITAGGPAPIIATYLLANHKAIAPGLPSYALVAGYIIVMCAIAFPAVLALKEFASKAPAKDVVEFPVASEV